MSEYRNGPDPWDLEPHYCKHVDAMTGEKLHAKSEIARELAFRDQQIEHLNKYAGHKMGCHANAFGKCSCGFSPISEPENDHE